MSIPLPNLDDRGYADLVSEARALLPSLAPEWTHHNPTDPGITLVELFAWLTEMVVWRTGQIPDAHVRGFLRLLNGPAWHPSPDRAADVRASVLAVRDAWRAVTPADYERLAAGDFNRWLAAQRAEEAAGGATAEWRTLTGLDPSAPEGRPSAVAPVARARCVPRRDLSAPTEAERAADRPGRVSLLVVPARDGVAPPPLAGAAPPAASPAQRQALAGWLDERRLLGTRLEVMAPVYVPVAAEVVVVRRPDVPDPAPPQALRDGWARVPETDVRKSVVAALAAWLDPLAGGPRGDGWPFGRDVHASEVYGALEALPGVDHVVEVRLASACPPGDATCVSAPEAWNDASGEPVGLALAAHHLPRAVLDPAAVHVGAALVSVHVEVSLDLATGVPYAAALRAVRETVRRLFHPGHGGPGGSAEVEVSAPRVRSQLRLLPEVDASRAVQVKLSTDAAHLLHPDEPEQQAARFAPREVADVSITLHHDGRRLWP